MVRANDVATTLCGKESNLYPKFTSTEPENVCQRCVRKAKKERMIP
jgi:hypothetical protein